MGKSSLSTQVSLLASAGKRMLWKFGKKKKKKVVISGSCERGKNGLVIAPAAAPLPSVYPCLPHETLMHLVRQKPAALGLRSSESALHASFDLSPS